MAVSGIDSSSGISILQAAVSAARKAGAGAAPAGGAKSSSSVSGSTSTSATDTYDDADTNKDGVVTALEQVTYDMKHPGEQKGSTVDVMA